MCVQLYYMCFRKRVIFIYVIFIKIHPSNHYSLMIGKAMISQRSNTFYLMRKRIFYVTIILIGDYLVLTAPWYCWHSVVIINWTVQHPRRNEWTLHFAPFNVFFCCFCEIEILSICIHAYLKVLPSFPAFAYASLYFLPHVDQLSILKCTGMHIMI